MSLEQKVDDVIVASNAQTAASQALAQDVAGKMAAIDQRVSQKTSELDAWKGEFTEAINGVTVHKQGMLKRYFLRDYLSSGGHASAGDGSDGSFPYCSNPQPPYFLNLLEFLAVDGFGSEGDMFRIEYLQSHRGMGGSYVDHFIFTGTTWSDSVAGSIEIKGVSDTAISIFISEPDNVAQEIAITADMKGSTIPVAFRTIGKGYDAGAARITLKIDTRHHCGADRAFGADVLYTSNRGRPPVSIKTQSQPVWNQ